MFDREEVVGCFVGDENSTVRSFLFIYFSIM